MIADASRRLVASLGQWRGKSLAPLRAPLFRVMWFAAFASNIGAVVQTIAAAWAMTTLVGSPQMVALVQTTAMLPVVLLSLPAGALADTFDRQALMLTSQILGAGAAALLACLAFVGLLSPLLLLALTFVIGTAVALHQPAWQASFVDLIPRTAIPAAVGLNALAFNGARSVGPALGGVIIAAFGAAAAFAFNALSFAGLIFILATRRFPSAESALPKEPLATAMLSGVRYVSLSPELRSVLIRGCLFGLGASVLLSLAPLIARTHLQGGPLTYGFLMAAFGLGSILAALFSAHVHERYGPERTLTAATLACAVSILAVGLSVDFAICAPFMLVAGACWIIVFTTTRTYLQLSAPRWVVGRAVALSQVASVGGMALGAALWGGLACVTGLATAFAAAAAFMASSALAQRFAPLPDVDQFQAAPSIAPPRAAAPTVDVGAHEGPVAIHVEYRTRPDQEAEFLGIMDQLGRIRRRNGATNWSLQRDIDQHGIWLERIVCSTWAEHKRRIGRSSPRDQATLAHAAAFRTSRAIQRTIGPSRARRPPMTRGENETT